MLTSSQTREEGTAVMQRVRQAPGSGLRLLYVTPEKVSFDSVPALYIHVLVSAAAPDDDLSLTTYTPNKPPGNRAGGEVQVPAQRAGEGERRRGGRRGGLAARARAARGGRGALLFGVGSRSVSV